MTTKPLQEILLGCQGPQAYNPCPSYLEVGIRGHRQASWWGGVCLRTDGIASFSPCCRPQKQSTGNLDSTAKGSGLLWCPVVMLPGSSPWKSIVGFDLPVSVVHFKECKGKWRQTGGREWAAMFRLVPLAHKNTHSPLLGCCLLTAVPSRMPGD